MLVPVFAVIVMLVYADPGTALLISILRQSIGFAVTLGLWTVYRRWPAATFRLVPHAGKIIACCLLATAADIGLAELARRLLDIPAPPEAVARGSMVLRLTLYAAWSALYFAIRQELESRDTVLRGMRAEADDREAELQLLRAQLNPHFLLSSLVTINGLASSNPAGIRDLVREMADYLRYSLVQTSHRAPLGDELTAMTSYLRVAQANHPSIGLTWNIDASPEARAALAPTALVQPLIENALKYGSVTSPPPLRLSIVARILNEELRLSVENSGEWVAPPSWEHELDATSGIGLSNLRRRLDLLHGSRARVEVQTPPGCVRVDVRLPLQPAPARA